MLHGQRSASLLWTFWLMFEHSLPLAAVDHETSMFNTGKVKDRSWDVNESYTD